MNKKVTTLLACAAFTGLYAGSLATRSYAADADAGKATTEHKTDKDKASCNGKDGCKATTETKKEGDKASCSGKDGCKAKESCKAKDTSKAKDSADTAKT